MTETPLPDTEVDVAEFCRRVEEHLTRVNEGHLVRVVGPAFELARTWALDGVPLSVVFHGIDLKAARHQRGRARRPLRLEFCEGDVRAVFDAWRRSVGLTASTRAAGGDEVDSPHTGRSKPSLTAHLDRAIDRLARVAGRLDLPDAFREIVDRVLTELASIREEARRLRGPARADLAHRLLPLDEALLSAARGAIGADELARIRADAESDLSAYRARLATDAWRRSVELNVDRLLRDRLGLPTLELEV